MCLSPHEMSTERIEEAIREIRKLTAGRPDLERFWAGRIAALEQLLKERADNGTLLDDEPAHAQPE